MIMRNIPISIGHSSSAIDIMCCHMIISGACHFSLCLLVMYCIFITHFDVDIYFHSVVECLNMIIKANYSRMIEQKKKKNALSLAPSCAPCQFRVVKNLENKMKRRRVCCCCCCVFDMNTWKGAEVNQTKRRDNVKNGVSKSNGWWRGPR